MSEGQKVIKYIAIAFAIFLTVNIIGGIITASLFIIGILGVTNEISINNSTEMMTFSDTFENIEDLTIDFKISRLTIKTGDEFRVEANYIENKFYCENKNGKLVIKEDGIINFLNQVNNSEIIIYIPEETKLNKVNIETGAGNVSISKLVANNLKLKLGAGNVDISNLEILEDTKIDSGVGKVIISKSILNNVDLNVGVGSFEIEAQVLGKSDIDGGIGKLKLKLIGEERDYQILAKKGLGSFKIDSKSIEDDKKYGNGDNYIKVEAGVGDTQIEFINN